MKEEIDDIMNIFDLNTEDIKSNEVTLNNVTLLDNKENEPEMNVVTPNQLLDDYTELEKSKEEINAKIQELMENNKEIFDILKGYEEQISELNNKQSEMRQTITDSIENAGLTEKGISNNIFKVKYVAATTRQNFDKDKFKKQYPVLFNQFITISDVKSYIKISKI